MAEEIKIYIENYAEVEEKIKEMGAEFLEEKKGKDTYFNPPEGEVIKITEDNTGNYFFRYVSTDGKFNIAEHYSLDDVNSKMQELTDKLGVRAVVSKTMRFFKWNNYTITLHIIDDVGQFMSVEGDKVGKEVLAELGFENPKYLTVSFDVLKLRAEGKA